MKKDTVIFDLDGTLADISQRRAEATKPDGKINWAKFFDPELVTALDTPNEAVVAMAKILASAGYKIWIFSGRSAVTQVATKNWLFDNEITYDRLIMRPDRSYTPDDQLKQEWLDKYFPGDERNRILCVYDDRDKVVAMWRNAGLTCMQVNYGDF